MFRAPKERFQGLAALAAAILMVGILGACSTDDTPETRTVVVTHSVLASIVEAVVPDSVEVVTLIPNGAEVHDFEPSARDISTLNEASLVVANGSGFEEGLSNALAEREQAGKAVFYATAHVSVIEVDGSEDPHFFTSPALVSEVLDPLALAVQEALDVEVDTAEFARTLDELITELDEQPIEATPLVTSHEFLGYFCAEFGCEVVGAIVDGLDTHADPSAKHLAEIKSAVAKYGSVQVIVEIGGTAEAEEYLSSIPRAAITEVAIEALPESGDYADYVRTISAAVTGNG